MMNFKENYPLLLAKLKWLDGKLNESKGVLWAGLNWSRRQ